MKKHVIHFFLRNWWVLTFFVIVSSFCLQTIYSKNCLIATLDKRRQELSQSKKKLEERREELLLRIESESDPEWIELVLKEKLGVKKEDELKVVFQ